MSVASAREPTRYFAHVVELTTKCIDLTARGKRPQPTSLRLKSLLTSGLQFALSFGTQHATLYVGPKLSTFTQLWKSIAIAADSFQSFSRRAKQNKLAIQLKLSQVSLRIVPTVDILRIILIESAMVHQITNILTLLTMLLHASVGCCWHHDHHAHSDAVAHSDVSSSTVSHCCSHHQPPSPATTDCDEHDQQSQVPCDKECGATDCEFTPSPIRNTNVFRDLYSVVHGTIDDGVMPGGPRQHLDFAGNADGCASGTCSRSVTQIWQL